jgi:hypothetical protein
VVNNTKKMHNINNFVWIEAFILFSPVTHDF